MPGSRSFDEEQELHWGATANRRPHDHPVVRAFAGRRVEFIARLFGGWRPATALDVGCGDGFGMWHMRSLAGRIRGCDRSLTMLQANPERSSVDRADAYALPYADARFELVYSWELLHHIGQPERVVAEMTRVASRGVLLCEPNCLNPAMALFGVGNRHERGLLRFPAWRTPQLLREAGLTNVRGFSGGWFTPNNTPAWLARPLARFPFRLPVIGLYVIALGFKPSSVATTPPATRA